MAVVMIEKIVMVPKETEELNQAFVNIHSAIKEALENGWQPGADIPAIGIVAFNQLAIGVQGVEKMGEEFKTETKAAVDSTLLSGTEIGFSYMKKPE